MSDPLRVQIVAEEGETRSMLIRMGLILAVGMLPYLLTSQRFQITVKAWVARFRREYAGARPAFDAGERVGNRIISWTRKDRAEVVAEAERITEGAP